MGLREKTIQIDLDKRQYSKVLFKQYDTNITLSLSVKDKGVKVTLTPYTVYAFYELPSGTIIEKRCTIDNVNGLVKTVIDNTILAESGFVKAEYRFMEGVQPNQKLVTNFMILLEVEPSIDYNNAVTKQPEWDVLIDAISKIPKWQHGNTVPTKKATDNEGDYYLHTTNGNVYKFTNGAWSTQPVANIKGLKGDTGARGPQGEQGIQGPTGLQGPTGTPGTKWHYGKGAPTDTAPAGARDGDYYLNIDNGDVYQRAKASWNTPIGNIQGPRGATGPQGVKGDQGLVGPTGPSGKDGTPGAKWHNGKGAPNRPAGAIVGDYYIDSTNGDYYYNDAQSGWVLVGRLTGGGTTPGVQGPAGPKGTDGATWHSGNGVPPQTTGSNGDFYLNTADSSVYKKGTNGQWAIIITTLKGANGQPGATGPAGPQGTAGKNGVNGTNGSKWHNGSGNPNTNAPTGFATGDYYIDNDNGEYYIRDANTWRMLGTLKGQDGVGTGGGTGTQGPRGPQGVPGTPGEDGATWHNGAIDPTPGIGKAGDYYLNTTQASVHKKDANNQTWTKIITTLKGTNGTTGPAGKNGVDGTKWHIGKANPDGTNVTGSNTGDYYLNTATGNIYKKTGTTTWVLEGNFEGPTGIEWFATNGVPSTNAGKTGDLHLNLTNGAVYRKTNGTTWTKQGDTKPTLVLSPTTPTERITNRLYLQNKQGTSTTPGSINKVIMNVDNGQATNGWTPVYPQTSADLVMVTGATTVQDFFDKGGTIKGATGFAGEVSSTVGFTTEGTVKLDILQGNDDPNEIKIGNGTCKIDARSSVLKVLTSGDASTTNENGIRMQGGAGGGFQVLYNSTQVHRLQNDGNKIGGTMEIDGTVYGMSPTDSPQTLIEYIVYDEEVQGEKIIKLDEIYSKMISKYAVFSSNPDIRIIKKEVNQFTVQGNGMADFNIKGQRKGAHEYYEIMGGIEHGTTEG